MPMPLRQQRRVALTDDAQLPDLQFGAASPHDSVIGWLKFDPSSCESLLNLPGISYSRIHE